MGISKKSNTLGFIFPLSRPELRVLAGMGLQARVLVINNVVPNLVREDHGLRLTLGPQGMPTRIIMTKSADARK